MHSIVIFGIYCTSFGRLRPVAIFKNLVISRKQLLLGHTINIISNIVNITINNSKFKIF